jgi:hypothetical protein
MLIAEIMMRTLDGPVGTVVPGGPLWFGAGAW